MTAPEFAARIRAASLGRRVVLGLAVLTVIISLVYSAALWWSFSWMRDFVATDLMKSQLTAKIQALENGVAPQENPGVTLYGTRPGLTPIPAPWRLLVPGLHEVTAERPCFLFILERGGFTYALLKEVGCFERAQLVYHYVIGLVALLVALGAFGGGWLLYRTIMTPVRRLSAAVVSSSNANRYVPIAVPDHEDEVSVLAKCCSTALERLYTALEREKRFTGDVTHELRTPLQTLSGSLELIVRGPLTDRQRTQADRALRALTDMQTLVDAFLQISRDAERIGPDAPDTLSRMIERMEEIWRPLARERKVQVTADSPVLCAGFYSPVLLGVVLNNLLRNAVSYSPAGGVVRITELTDGFSVEDEAGGIDPERVTCILSGGRRADGAAGYGIGLALVHRICTRCGWTLTHENTARGSLFTVRLSSADAAGKPRSGA